MGFNVYQLDADDDNWKEKVIARVEEIRKKEEAACDSSVTKNVVR